MKTIKFLSLAGIISAVIIGSMSFQNHPVLRSEPAFIQVKDTIPQTEMNINIDVEKILSEVDKALAKIDFDKIAQQVEESLQKIDFSKMQKDIDASLKSIDWNKINLSIDSAMKNIDTKKIGDYGQSLPAFQ